MFLWYYTEGGNELLLWLFFILLLIYYYYFRLDTYLLCNYNRNIYCVSVIQLDEWSEKFDQDNETKQQELDKLRDVRAQDLVKLQDLTETYNEYERVITKDRKQKQKLQDAAQRLVFLLLV